jgi:cation diffusion facilitator CzcD-associated flavoprotein CzcO
MRRTSVVIIGGGQAGLAVSYLLAAASVDHVVLERARIAESWRSRRWDSLRLLTPNWMSRLPGWSYRGPDPGGFMPADFGSRLSQPVRRLLRRPGGVRCNRSLRSDVRRRVRRRQRGGSLDR